jgi:Aspartyl protease
MRPWAFVRFNTSSGKPKPVTIKVLLDSGTSESLISKKYVSKLRVKSSKKKGTVWSTTPGGDLHTILELRGHSISLNFKTRSSSNGIYTWQRTWAYDMIIG